MGINWVLINGKYPNHLRLADNIVIVAESPKDLVKMVTKLDEKSQKVGLDINTIKTKIITNYYKRSIKVNGHTIEYVYSYIYLWKQISFIQTVT